MKALRFHEYGEPADVLYLEDTDVPIPGAGQIRVRVFACGLNPADWYLCRGLFPGRLPRGIGLDVSGKVEAVGEGVTDVRVGQDVVGVPDYQGHSSAGAAEQAVLNVWTPLPAGLDPVQAAALPMAVETAFRCLDILGVSKGQTLLVYGAGTTVGFSAVQIALSRGARVIAAAGDAFADRLRPIGAEVTSYGGDMIERVRELAGGVPDLILDAGPPSDALPRLMEIAAGDAGRVLTIGNHGPAAEKLGVHSPFETGLRYEALTGLVERAGDGRFTIPIAGTYPLGRWREAMDVSLGGYAHGKLMLIPNGSDDR